MVAVTDPEADPNKLQQLRTLCQDVFVGPDAMTKLVARADVDIVLAAVVGAAGMPAVLATVEAGKTLALANKESLVVAGSLVVPAARQRGVRILPVDSEHSAIFQAVQCGRREEIRRVILTASGGPFRTVPIEQMARATYAEALQHPTWQMGAKITVDSATMFNKALELIEACWLFDLPPEKVEIVIHPESVVHSMVEFVDGSTIAQLSPPDMRIPIQYALTYPERATTDCRRLDLSKPMRLNFEPPDPQRFPAVRIAYEVAAMGGTAGAVMNAANEAAVAAFAGGRISFGQISQLVDATIRDHKLQQHPSLEELMVADASARTSVERLIGRTN